MSTRSTTAPTRAAPSSAWPGCYRCHSRTGPIVGVLVDRSGAWTPGASSLRCRGRGAGRRHRRRELPRVRHRRAQVAPKPPGARRLGLQRLPPLRHHLGQLAPERVAGPLPGPGRPVRAADDDVLRAAAGEPATRNHGGVGLLDTVSAPERPPTGGGNRLRNRARNLRSGSFQGNVARNRPSKVPGNGSTRRCLTCGTDRTCSRRCKPSGTETPTGVRLGLCVLAGPRRTPPWRG